MFDKTGSGDVNQSETQSKITECEYLIFLKPILKVWWAPQSCCAPKKTLLKSAMKFVPIGDLRHISVEVLLLNYVSIWTPNLK